MENHYTSKIKIVKIESAVKVHFEVKLNIQDVLLPPTSQFPDLATPKVLSLEQISDYF